MKRLGAAIAASVAVLLAAAPAAAGAVPLASTTPAPDAPEASPAQAPSAVGQGLLTAQLDSLGSAALDPTSRLSATVTSTNRGETEVDEVVLELALTESPLADRAALETFIDDPQSFPTRFAAQQPEVPEETADEVSGPFGAGDGVPGSLPSEVPDEEPVGMSIPAGASTTMTIGATPDELGLPSGQWGVYGAVLTLRTPEGDVEVDAIPLTWQGADVPTLALSTLTMAAGPARNAEAVLSASNVPGVASAVDPALVTNTVAFDAGLVERETFRLASGSPDLTSLAHAENTSLLELSLSMPAGTNLATVDRAPWLAVPAAIDTSSVNAASALGARASIALPSAAGYEDLAAADAPVAQSGDAVLLVPDEGLSQSLAQYRPGSEAAVARILAESALLAAEADGAPVLVVLDSSWLPPSADPSATLEALTTAPWVEPVSVSDLLEAEPAAVELETTLGVEDDLSAEGVAALDGALEDLTTLAAATTSPSAAIADWGSALLQGVEVSLRANPGVRDAATSAALTEADGTLASLRIAESSDLNLLAETGEIPITVVNRLDHDVSVRVDLTSFSPNLQVLATPTVTVTSGQEAAALVPVEAVSSDNVRVSVVLRSPEGPRVSEEQSFAVRVRADWGNAATAVFSVVLVLLLIAGLIRTARRGRKDTREDPAPAPALAPEREVENINPDDGTPEGDGADDSPPDPHRTERD